MLSHTVTTARFGADVQDSMLGGEFPAFSSFDFSLPHAMTTGNVSHHRLAAGREYPLWS
jgi:hypothetical protein